VEGRPPRLRPRLGLRRYLRGVSPLTPAGGVGRLRQQNPRTRWPISQRWLVQTRHPFHGSGARWAHIRRYGSASSSRRRTESYSWCEYSIAEKSPHPRPTRRCWWRSILAQTSVRGSASEAAASDQRGRWLVCCFCRDVSGWFGKGLAQPLPPLRCAGPQPRLLRRIGKLDPTVQVLAPQGLEGSGLPRERATATPGASSACPYGRAAQQSDSALLFEIAVAVLSELLVI
jgi:hypothetical protein